MYEDRPVGNILTLNRSGSKWVFGEPDGAGRELIEVPADTFAVQSEPSTGEPLGLFLEAEETENRFPDSETFSTGLVWKGNHEIIEDPRYGNVVKLIVDSESEHAQVRTGYVFNAADSEMYSDSMCSFIAKAGTVSKIFSHTFSGQGDAYYLQFDLETGEITRNNGGSPTRFGSFPLKDDWWGFWYVRGLGGWSSRGFSVGMDNQHYGPFSEGDYFYVGKCMRVPQGHYGSYIPTYGDGIRSRDKDVCTYTPTFRSYSGMTYFLDFIPFYNVDGGEGSILLSGGINPTEYFRVSIDATGSRDGQLNVYLRGQNAVQHVTRSSNSAIYPGQRVRMAFTIHENQTVDLVVNGVLYQGTYNQLPRVASQLTLQGGNSSIRIEERWIKEPVTTEQLLNMASAPG